MLLRACVRRPQPALAGSFRVLAVRPQQPFRAFSEYASSQAVENPKTSEEPIPYSGVLPDETRAIGRVGPSIRDYQEISLEDFEELEPQDQVRQIMDLIQMSVEPARGLLLTDLEEFPVVDNVPSYLTNLGVEEYSDIAQLAQEGSLNKEDRYALDLWVRFIPNQADENAIRAIPNIDEDDAGLLRMEFTHQAINNSNRFYAYKDEFLTRTQILEQSYFNVFGHPIEQASELLGGRLVHPLESEI